MSGFHFSATDAQPPSIAEWEELLIRLEIAPRALRAALDEVPREREASVADLLRAASAAERHAIAVLDALAAGTPLPAAAEDEACPASHESNHALSEAAAEFARLRAGLFARVQRRGLNVWAWEGLLPDGGRITAYQLLLGVMARDAQTLAAVRGAARRERAPC